MNKKMVLLSIVVLGHYGLVMPMKRTSDEQTKDEQTKNVILQKKSTLSKKPVLSKKRSASLSTVDDSDDVLRSYRKPLPSVAQGPNQASMPQQQPPQLPVVVKRERKKLIYSYVELFIQGRNNPSPNEDNCYAEKNWKVSLDALLSVKAEINYVIRNSTQYTPLAKAVQNRLPFGFLQLLINNGANVNQLVGETQKKSNSDIYVCDRIYLK